jgi:hypothetical protein
LLREALEEQEREQAGFMKVLQSSRDALAATRLELDALRAVLEKRDEAMLQALDARLGSLAGHGGIASIQSGVDATAREMVTLRRNLTARTDAVSATLDAVDARNQEAIGALAERIATLEHAMEDSVLAVSGELAAAGRRADDQARMLEERLSSIERTLDARQQEVADAILKALDPVGRIMQLVQGRLARAASDLAVAQGSLLSRLLERDDRLERDRDRVLAELLNEFAGNLKPRDRQRIGAGLLAADEERRHRRDLGRANADPVPAYPDPPDPYAGAGDGAAGTPAPPGLAPPMVPGPPAPAGPWAPGAGTPPPPAPPGQWAPGAAPPPPPWQGRRGRKPVL